MATSFTGTGSLLKTSMVSGTGSKPMANQRLPILRVVQDFRRIAVFEDGRVCQQGVNVFSEPYEVGS